MGVASETHKSVSQMSLQEILASGEFCFDFRAAVNTAPLQQQMSQL